jgi:hypothetical protein
MAGATKSTRATDNPRDQEGTKRFIAILPETIGPTAYTITG